MKGVVSAFSLVAFSGSRACPGAVAAVKEVLPMVSKSAQVSVGCQLGVDFAVRAHFESCTVFRVSAFRRPGAPVAAAFALRSQACIKSVAPAGLVVVCPAAGQACPGVIQPSKKWCSGGGSGSWASAALALGLGCSALLWLSEGTKPPRWAVLITKETFPAASGGSWLLLKREPQEESHALLFG